MISTDKFHPLKTIGAALVGTSRKTRIVSISALVLAAVAFGAAGVAPLAPDAAKLPVRSVSETLALPDLAAQISALEHSCWPAG